MSHWRLDPFCEIGTGKNTASKNSSIVRGLRYHRKVYKALAEWLEKHPESPYKLWVEPWFRREFRGRRQMCQPDAVLECPITGGGLIVEAKLNWKDGRDEKLLNTYLDASRQALGLSTVWPVVITSNVRGYKGTPLVGLKHLERALEWEPGQLTPVLLLP